MMVVEGRSASSRSGLQSLLGTFLTLRAGSTGRGCRDGQRTKQWGEAVAAVRTDHFEALAGGAVPVEGDGQALPFGGAFSVGELEVNDPVAPVGEEAGGD